MYDDFRLLKICDTLIKGDNYKADIHQYYSGWLVRWCTSQGTGLATEDHGFKSHAFLVSSSATLGKLLTQLCQAAVFVTSLISQCHLEAHPGHPGESVLSGQLLRQLTCGFPPSAFCSDAMVHASDGRFLYSKSKIEIFSKNRKKIEIQIL